MLGICFGHMWVCASQISISWIWQSFSICWCQQYINNCNFIGSIVDTICFWLFILHFPKLAFPEIVVQIFHCIGTDSWDVLKLPWILHREHEFFIFHVSEAPCQSLMWLRKWVTTLGRDRQIHILYQQILPVLDRMHHCYWLPFHHPLLW